LNPDEVLPRITALAQTPYLFQQGNLDLCVAGTFFYHMFVLKPSETAQFSKGLYGQGQAVLGKLNVTPGDDLRNANYRSMFQKTDLKFVPPQADWMLMGSIRDSENRWFDYEGDPTEKKSPFTLRQMKLTTGTTRRDSSAASAGTRIILPTPRSRR
jgi:hypothetical protein